MRLKAKGIASVLTNDVNKSRSPLPSKAMHYYLQLRGIGKAKTFHQAAIRNIRVVTDILNDRVLSEYRSVNAGQVMDDLLARNLSVLSYRRIFTNVKAVINLSITEHGIDIRNPFSQIYLSDGKYLSLRMLSVQYSKPVISRTMICDG